MNTDTKHRPTKQDWPRSKIKMHLEDAGWSLRQLSLKHGRSPGAGAQALHQPDSPLMEQIIADAIGVAPAVIWPTRYPDGVRAASYLLRRAAKSTATRRVRKNQDHLNIGDAA